jgi:intracellular sulfur oxidation DsrE/DsrF family protein
MTIARLTGAIALTFALTFSAAHAAGTGKTHHLLLAVDSTDKDAMALGLRNAEAAQRLYSSRGESLEVEVVAYGPGIEMLRADKSPVKEAIERAKKAVGHLTLSMCGNAKAGAEKREGHPITPLPGVQVVPAGIVRVMELQEQGWSYVKP